MASSTEDAASVKAVVVGEARPPKSSAKLKYVPAFLGVFLAYLAGYYLFNDPRASWTGDSILKISWAEIMLLLAAMVAISEQLRVSHPGVDNTLEVALMGLMAVVQVVCMFLALADAKLWGIGFSAFKTTEFIMQTILSGTAAVVAGFINSRSMSRSIVSGN